MVVTAQTEHVTSAHTAEDKPRLLFFYAPTSGRDRRAESVLARVLQQHRNQRTFSVQRIDVAARPNLAARFRIRETPTILIVQGNKVVARAHRPKGREDLADLLSPWLRS